MKLGKWFLGQGVSCELHSQDKQLSILSLAISEVTKLDRMNFRSNSFRGWIKILILTSSIVGSAVCFSSLAYSSAASSAVEILIGATADATIASLKDDEPVSEAAIDAIATNFLSKVVEAGLTELFDGLPVYKKSELLSLMKNKLRQKVKDVLSEPKEVKLNLRQMGGALLLDTLVNVTLDVTSEVIKDEFQNNGTFSSIAAGQTAYWAIQQLKVAYAFKKGGLLSAVVAETMFVGGQTIELVQLHQQLLNLNNNNIALAKLNEANAYIFTARSDYFTTDPKLKFLKMIEIKAYLRQILQVDGSILQGANSVIENITHNIELADDNKYIVFEALLRELAANPNNVTALHQKLLAFVEGKFFNNGKEDSSNELESLKLRIDNVISSFPVDPPPPQPCPVSGCLPIPLPVKDPAPKPETATASGKWFGMLTGVTHGTYTYVDNNGHTITGNSTTSTTDGVVSGSKWDVPIVNGGTVTLKKPFEDAENSFGTLTVPENNAAVKRQYFKAGYFGNLNDAAAGTYQYTAWGRWNGNVGVEGNNGVTNFSIKIPKGYWVVGDMAKSSVIDKRSGTANYKGNLIGDLLEYGSTNVLTAALVGDVAFKINFDQNSMTDAVSGNLNIKRAVTGETWFKESFSGGSLVTHFTEQGTTFDIPFIKYETPNAFSGLNDHLSLKGLLYGTTGQELGGSFHIQEDGDIGVGVFRAKEQ